MNLGNCIQWQSPWQPNYRTSPSLCNVPCAYYTIHVLLLTPPASSNHSSTFSDNSFAKISYNQNHAVHSILCFTFSLRVSEIYPCVVHNNISSSSCFRLLFHPTQFVCLLISWWTFGFLPVWGWNVHTFLWEYMKEMGIPDHLTCLLRNPYAGQEAKVRTRHGTTDWFQIGKGARQGCMLSPCLFNLYAEYIMRNAGLNEAQAGIKISGRNINNLK